MSFIAIQNILCFTDPHFPIAFFDYNFTILLSRCSVEKKIKVNNLHAIVDVVVALMAMLCI